MNLISQNDQMLLNCLQSNLNKSKSMTRVNRTQNVYLFIKMEINNAMLFRKPINPIKKIIHHKNQNNLTIKLINQLE